MDPVRNILVKATPEEKIRQDVLRTLKEDYGYDYNSMDTELYLKGGVRADVVIWGEKYTKNNNHRAQIVVETKRSSIDLDDSHEDQVRQYCEILKSRFLVLTNGTETRVYQRTGRKSYRTIRDIPPLQDLNDKLWSPDPVDVPAVRLTDVLHLEQLTDDEWLSREFQLIYKGSVIGSDTPKELWPLIINMHHLLMQPDILFYLEEEFENYKFLEDRLLSRHNAGNASGDDGRDLKVYRSFLVEDPKGNNHVVRFTVRGWPRLNNDAKYKTQKGTSTLNVMIDGNASHALQLTFDRYAFVSADSYNLWHDGRKGGSSGLKRTEVTNFVQTRVPSLLREMRIDLGSLPRNRVIGWPDAREAILRIAVYAILRDELLSKTVRKTRSKTQAVLVKKRLLHKPKSSVSTILSWIRGRQR